METRRVRGLIAAAALFAALAYGRDVIAKDCSVSVETWKLTRTSLTIDGASAPAEIETGLVVSLAANRFVIRSADTEQVQGLSP